MSEPFEAQDKLKLRPPRLAALKDGRYIEMLRLGEVAALGQGGDAVGGAEG